MFQEGVIVCVVCFPVPLAVTLICLILFAIKRRWVALGILMAAIINAVGSLLYPGAVAHDLGGASDLWMWALFGWVPFFLG